MAINKTFFNWSTGKDSALALQALLANKQYEVGALLTTVNEHYGRVSIHGLRRALLEAQTFAIGIASEVVLLPETVSNSNYEDKMGAMVSNLVKQGYTHAAFGDIFLEDLRAYRERQLAPSGIQAIFPLWKEDTAELANKFIAGGFQAITVSVDAGKLDATFVGRLFDADFLRDLPSHIDPCGENGEFHTFCFDGPIFQHPVAFTKGEIVYREYPMSGGEHVDAWYCDLVPNN